MKTKSLPVFLSIALACYQPLSAQDRIVADKKAFICTMSDRDTFQTAAEGCRHWAEKHLPAGYKFQEGSAVTRANGSVKCICKKTNQTDNTQEGMIMGIVICPKNASEVNVPPTSFESRKCQCYQTFVSHDGKCVKPEEVPFEDECTKQQNLTPQQVALKNQVIQKLQAEVEKASKAFAKDPTIATTVFSANELTRYGKASFQKYIWDQGYGHVVERLTAKAVSQDPFLNGVLEYVPNYEQTKGLPDFKGKGQLPSSLSFDITTAGQVERKKTKGKECWEFITYVRLVNADGTPVK